MKPRFIDVTTPLWIRQIRGGLLAEGHDKKISGEELARVIRENESPRWVNAHEQGNKPNIEVRGFRITGKTDLCDLGRCRERPLSVKFIDCKFDDAILLDHARVHRLVFHRCWLVAVIARGIYAQRVVLDEAMPTVAPGVTLHFQSAHIADSLVVRKGQFAYLPQVQQYLGGVDWGERLTFSALDLADIRVGNDVIISGKDLPCVGNVMSQEANIGGSLEISGVKISPFSYAEGVHRYKETGGLDIAGCTIGTNFELSESTVDGSLKMTFSRIGNNVMLQESSIGVAGAIRPGVDARGIAVGRELLLDQCRISGDAVFAGATLGASFKFFDSRLISALDEADVRGEHIPCALNATDLRSGGDVSFGWANDGDVRESGVRTSYKERMNWKQSMGIANRTGALLQDIRLQPPSDAAKPPYVEGAISFERAHIQGDFIVDGLLLAAPKIRGGRNIPVNPHLMSIKAAQIGGYLRIKELLSLDEITVDLSHVSARALADSLNDGWNPRGHVKENLAPRIHVNLDGFIYEELDDLDPEPTHDRPFKRLFSWFRSDPAAERRLRSRLEWLRDQRIKNFHPYFQLARTYAATGFEKEARAALMAGLKEEYKRKTQLSRCIGFLYGSFFGYGYEPKRALATFALVAALGFGLAYYAKEFRLFVVDTTSTVALYASAPKSTFQPADMQPVAAGRNDPSGNPKLSLHSSIDDAEPSEQLCSDLHPLAYALDVMVPFLDLREKSHCTFTTRDRNGFPAWLSRVIMALYAGLGAIVTSLTVLTISGVLRRNPGGS